MVIIIEGKRFRLLKEYEGYTEAYDGFSYYRELTGNPSVIIAEFNGKWGVYLKMRE